MLLAADAGVRFSKGPFDWTAAEALSVAGFGSWELRERSSVWWREVGGGGEAASCVAVALAAASACMLRFNRVHSLPSSPKLISVGTSGRIHVNVHEVELSPWDARPSVRQVMCSGVGKSWRAQQVWKWTAVDVLSSTPQWFFLTLNEFRTTPSWNDNVTVASTEGRR